MTHDGPRDVVRCNILQSPGATEPWEESDFTITVVDAAAPDLTPVAAEVGVSPVYLTQTFAQVEALPLYRYQLRLRLARALDRIADVDDLAQLGLELGFSSHSHFSAAFQQAYGRSPSEFRDAVIARRQRKG